MTDTARPRRPLLPSLTSSAMQRALQAAVSRVEAKSTAKVAVERTVPQRPLQRVLLKATYKLISRRLGSTVASGRVTSLGETRARLVGALPGPEWVDAIDRQDLQIAIRLELPSGPVVTLYGSISQSLELGDLRQLLIVELFPLTPAQRAPLGRYFQGTQARTRMEMPAYAGLDGLRESA
jgi:hypothetical protein